MKRLVILGFGGYGKTIEDVVMSAKMFDEVIFLDDKAENEKVKGAPATTAGWVRSNFAEPSPAARPPFVFPKSIAPRRQTAFPVLSIVGPARVGIGPNLIKYVATKTKAARTPISARSRIVNLFRSFKGFSSPFS